MGSITNNIALKVALAEAESLGIDSHCNLIGSESLILSEEEQELLN